MPADPEGRWHAKDHLAHLTWWRRRNVAVMEAVGAGTPLPELPRDDAVTNARIYAETKDRTVAEIGRDARAAWSAFESALEACSEGDLAKPHPNFAGNQVWEVVPGMGGHIGGHMMAWYMDAGKVERAEAAARWGYAFESALLPEGAKRAEASYNLACFFARAGRVDEAVPLLRDGLRFQPSLVEWAREDPDLAGIRDRDEVRELLARS